MGTAGLKLKPRREDLTGQRFGMLVVRSFADKAKKVVRWLCQCDCGASAIVRAPSLRAGDTRSCGCVRRGNNWNRSGNLKHGHSYIKTTRGTRGVTALYRTWSSMIQRCTNPNAKNYKWYGARGISVCERWLNSFEAFAADMGERPDGLSIDRIDNDGNYEPGNVKWSTQSEQVRNSRSRKRRTAEACH